MSKEELEPMLENNTSEDDDDFDYVFLVVNPFVSQPSGSVFDRFYTKEEAEKTFLAVFKTTVEGKTPSESQRELSEADPEEDLIL